MKGSYETVEVKLEDGVGELTLNRPEQLNSLNQQLRQDLKQAFSELETADIRVLTIRGSGKAFSAGADIEEFKKMAPHRFREEMSGFFQLPEKFPQPTVAAIDGYALGGGLELALSCDLRIATERSLLGQPEINLGLIPGGGGTQRLPRIIGLTRAKDLIMTGRKIDGKTAEDWGLINEVTPKEEFNERVEEFVEQLKSGPPIALREAKHVINRGVELPLEDALDVEKRSFSLLLTTEDAREGIDAFQENREPDFKGS